ncbi:MAG: diacylglycerol kinase family lipid kinase, partial [Ignavibacteriaceae bacterium]
WLVIVNPNAGRGLGKKDWQIISDLLKAYKINYEAQFTEYKKHAIELAKQGIASGYRKIIAVGGDGTMNEIVNGCFLQTTCPATDLTLSIVTVGTGNDWGKMFGIPADYEGAVKVISEGKTCLHDTGVVFFYHGARRERRYFINIAGLGFDAVVVRRTNIQKEKGRKGKMLYFWNLIVTLISYRHTQTDVVIDGEKISEKIFTISLGIGKYSGGGMVQTPGAIHDDGLFDITIIKEISRRNVIKSLKMLYNGTILEHPLTMGYKGSNIIIDADPLIHVEADGETLGHSPIEFKILPSSINVIYNRISE